MTLANIDMSQDKIQTPLLQVQDVHTTFNIKQKGTYFWQKPDTLKAVNGVSFELFPGETLGVVGESGCGKSTLARTIIGLVRANAGSIKFGDEEIVGASKKTMRIKRKDIQMIFQDPLASLNPRMTVGDIIARALILKPKIIICDEPVSALDVSIQAQVINLLQDLQQEMGLSLIFIAHDLSVIKHIAHRVLVMYLGHAVELGTGEAVYGNPTHPYTQALMSAVPLPDPIAERNKTIQLLEGELPSPINPPSGCVFRTRCPIADSECAQTKPILEGALDHRVACLKNKVEMV